MKNLITPVAILSAFFALLIWTNSVSKRVARLEGFFNPADNAPAQSPLTESNKVAIGH